MRCTSARAPRAWPCASEIRASCADVGSADAAPREFASIPRSNAALAAFELRQESRPPDGAACALPASDARLLPRRRTTGRSARCGRCCGATRASWMAQRCSPRSSGAVATSGARRPNTRAEQSEWWLCLSPLAASPAGPPAPAALAPLSTRNDLGRCPVHRPCALPLALSPCRHCCRRPCAKSLSGVRATPQTRRCWAGGRRVPSRPFAGCCANRQCKGSEKTRLPSRDDRLTAPRGRTSSGVCPDGCVSCKLTVLQIADA